PSSFAEVEQHQPWRHAMIEELDSIESNKTWCLVTLPPGHRPIGLNWVYKVKKNRSGEVVKCKPRLVAKGYVQQPGINYDEAFAPMVRIESVRCCSWLLLLKNDRRCTTWTSKSAFLNGDLRRGLRQVACRLHRRRA
ncbi:reverse transcriptase domain-containing protein, partial [Klebsiella pneumoniae]